MNLARAALAVLGLCVLSCRPTGSSAVAEAWAAEPSAGASADGVAVVELFTSEGCSSCPPADVLLGELSAGAPHVYALSFHVDYWDELGWRDPFGSPESTARQRAYARSFGAGGLYTPQMVVNGISAFTGSDRSRAAPDIARALAQPAQVPLAIRVRSAPSHAIAVDYDAPGAPADAVIHLAVVERSTSSDVRAGENAGRVLHHTNVVLAFGAVRGKSHGTEVLKPKVPLAPDEGEVIAYVQRAADSEGGMPVLGATRAPLPR